MKRTFLCVVTLLTLSISSRSDTVVIERCDDVPTNTPVTIRVQVWPIGEETYSNLTVELRCLSGAAAAVFFPSTSTVVGITNTSYLKVIGTVPSSIPTNMALEVLSAGQTVASNSFTVLASSVMSSSNAIALAQSATSMSIPSDAPVGVTLAGGRYTVTFFTAMEAGLMQGDYYAQIELDAATGTIYSTLSGP
jgi:hypothetical protein